MSVGHNIEGWGLPHVTRSGVVVRVARVLSEVKGERGGYGVEAPARDEP
jgi:hypothetical protein